MSSSFLFLLCLLCILLFLSPLALADSSWVYGVTANPPFNYITLGNTAPNIAVALDDDNDVYLNATAAASPIAFTFYGYNTAPSDWVLNANGYLSFFGQTSTGFAPPCPLPDSVPLSNSFEKGFAFFFTDLKP